MKIEDTDSGVLIDAMGWIDDFNSPAGHVGMPFTRKIMIRSELDCSVGPYLRQLKQSQFSEDEVREVMLQVLTEAYDETR